MADNAIVRFFEKPVRQELASQQAGHDVYIPVDFVEVLFPKEDKSITHRKVRDEDKTRWARQWDAYQQGKAQTPDGTPIELWPAATPTEIEMLKSCKFLTVELLAGATDLALQKVPNGMVLKTRAKRFLEEMIPQSQAAAVTAQFDEQAGIAERMVRSAAQTIVTTDESGAHAAGLVAAIKNHLPKLQDAAHAVDRHYGDQSMKIHEAKQGAKARADQVVSGLKDHLKGLEEQLKKWSDARKEAEEKAPGLEPAKVTVRASPSEFGMPAEVSYGG